MKRMIAGMCCVLMVFSLASCKPKYVSPMESPAVGMDENAPYEIDFVQVHNDIVDTYASDDRFPFIKNVVIDGTNDPKQVNIEIEAVDNVSQDAIDLFIATLLINISEEARIQDSRYTAPSSEGFGSFYDKYAVKIHAVSGDTVMTDTTYEAGEGLPYNQNVETDGSIPDPDTKVSAGNQDAESQSGEDASDGAAQ